MNILTLNFLRDEVQLLKNTKKMPIKKMSKTKKRQLKRLRKIKKKNNDTTIETDSTIKI